MSSNINLHELLNKKTLNLENVREFLERDHSSINESDERAYDTHTPLVTVLRNSQCSIEIVRLLLQFDADVNLGSGGYTPLFTALAYLRDEAIVEALLKKGANVDGWGYREQPPLYYIFPCNINQSINFELKKNILKLLLRAGLDLNKVIASGAYERQSYMCLALGCGADVRDIELLLSNGSLLNTCEMHATPLHCVTHRYTGVPLKASVVQLLLDKQACKDEVLKMGVEPLQNALILHQYEPSAIRLLLERSDEKAVNTWIRQTNNVLHFVVGNRNCTTTLVKLFLKRGACIDKLTDYGKTVLHSFMRDDRKDLSVLEFLLKSGVPVNVMCTIGRTPLSEAVGCRMKNNAINLLLAFGARFGILWDGNGISLLESAIRRYHDQEDEYVFKTLVKYYFLEFPNFNVQRLIEGHCEHRILSVFVSNCYNELDRMETMNVRSDCSLRRFISENHLLDIKTDQERKAAIDDCNQLLKILSSNDFPEYFDVMASKMLASKVAEVVLESHLEKLIVFSFNAKIDKSLGNASAIKKVVLVHDIVCKKLSQYLSAEELLRLIVAFYNADDLPYNNSAPQKRKPNSEL